MPTYTKYPRSVHLPWSAGATSDDKTLNDVQHFGGHDVVVTVKQDGENTTLYRDYMHARSLTYEHHESRSMVRSMHAAIKHLIPQNFRICGGNLYARHSIEYQALTAHFQVFSIWELPQLGRYGRMVSAAWPPDGPGALLGAVG